MDKQKLNLILDRLLKKTKAGELEWQSTVNKETLLVALDQAAISIFKALDNYYMLDFRNNMGEVIESVVVSDIDSLREETKAAKEIFDLAYKQTLKGDKTLDHILEQLAA